MASEDPQKILDELAASSRRMADVIDRQMKLELARGSSTDEAAKKTLEFVNAVRYAERNMRTSSDRISASIDGLDQAFREGNLTAKDLNDELLSLRNQVNNTADQEKKRELIEKKRHLEEINLRNQVSANLKDTFFTQLGTVVGGTTKAIAGLAKSALSGSDAMEIAAQAMKSQIEIVNNSFQAGAKGVGELGQHMAGAGGKVGIAGVVLTGLSSAAGIAAGQLSELATAGIDFMMRSVKGFIRDFNSMSQAGAIYSGGMDAMIKTASDGGMTLEQFSKVVSDNKEKFARLGMSVAEGSKKLASVMQAGGKPMRDGMFALGMSMEEQGEAVATVMQRLAGPTQRLTASNAEVAAATQSYVRDLKTLQNITGEDVKSKQEKIRQENDTLAMQQKLAGMDETKRTALLAAMDSMTDSQRRALRENMIYGTVISKDIAIAQASNAGLKEANDRAYQAAMDGSLNAEKQKQIQADTREATERDAKKAVGLGMAMSEAARDAAKVVLENWDYTAKFSEQALAAAKKASDEQQKKGQEGTAGPEVDLQVQMQEFSTKLQEIAHGNLNAFATALDSTFKNIEKTVLALAKASTDVGTSLGELFSIEALSALIGSLILPVGTMIMANFAKGKAIEQAGGLATRGATALVTGGQAAAAGGVVSGGAAAAGGGLAAAAAATGAVLAAGAVGYGVGTLVDKALDNFGGKAKILDWLSSDKEKEINNKITEGLSKEQVEEIRRRKASETGKSAAAAGAKVSSDIKDKSVAATGDKISSDIKDKSDIFKFTLDRVTASADNLATSFTSLSDSLTGLAKLPSTENLSTNNVAAMDAFNKDASLTKEKVRNIQSETLASDPLTQLLDIAQQQLYNQREMLAYMRDQKDLSRKMLQSLA
jgi:hypothetical protein